MSVERTEPALSREAIAKIEVGHTTIHGRTAWALVVFFLTAVFVVPSVQWVRETRATGEGDTESAWSHLAGLGEELRARLATEKVAGAGAIARIVEGDRVVLAALDAFQDALEDADLLSRVLRPPAQYVLSGWLGAGNEQVYCGRQGWLFYRPEVEYLTGPRFLVPAELARRVAAASEWTTPPQPDPRTAIVQFKRQLEARGITLVLAPTPVKPMVHPEKLAQAYERWPNPLQNPSYASFVEDLGKDDVLMFDVASALVQARRGSWRPQYLATDTHWRPESMQAVAELLGAFLRAHVTLPDLPNPGYRTEVREVRNLGDLSLMLDLPRDQILYPPETVFLRRVLGPGGELWRPSRSADVLVLGDSFSNVYSLASMGWGDSAGFVEQLSYVLKRPIDRIVQNDDGAFATREMLSRDLAGGADRLGGKRVVIWQFAARELAVGDWRLIEVPY